MTLTEGSGHKPSILISFPYLTPFLNKRSAYVNIRGWVMDSGAFTVHKSGGSVSLSEYTDTCLRLLKEDSQLEEVFALDVIGDWKQSRKNADAMWERGVPAIPCFHAGEPWHVLLSLSKTFPKVALGGAVGLKSAAKLTWARECFARVWPKKVHGFGFASQTHLMALPFHTTDASSWATGPRKFGNWKTYGKLSYRGSNQNLRCEVESYLALERRLWTRWKKEMELLEALP